MEKELKTKINKDLKALKTDLASLETSLKHEAYESAIVECISLIRLGHNIHLNVAFLKEQKTLKT